VAEVKLSAETRSEFGKGAARRLRRAHKVPAVLYGHGADPVHVALPGHETMLALKHTNTLLALDIEGTSQLALPKDVQRNPTKGFIEHVDLLIVRRGERVTVDIPVHVTGSPVSGTIVNTDYTTLSVEVEATAIPQQLVVDIDGAADGTHITAGEVTLPAGATLVTDPEALVVTISTPAAADLGEAEAAEAEAAEPTADTAVEGSSAEG
jgi:large subunit ribosomal protein L25